LGSILKVPINWNTSAAIQHSKINCIVARETLLIIVANVAIVWAAVTPIIYCIRIKPFQTGRVTVVGISEEESHFAGCAVGQRNASQANIWTGKTNS